MPLRAKRNVEKLEICEHGGLNYEELQRAGVKPDSVLDFSVCTNPYMPPPELQYVCTPDKIAEYPDSTSLELRLALERKLKISRDNILIGNGTTEIIRLIALAYIRARDKTLIAEPTFGEYEVACRIAGASVAKFRMGLECDPAQVVEAVRQHKPRVFFLCNPNNPTGCYLSRQTIIDILKATGDNLFVLDEAYVNFIEKPWDSKDLIEKGNLIVLHSMTKDFGLAGLRLGYSIASSEITDNLRRVCPPWNVNVVAQKSGLAALGFEEYLDWSRKETHQLKNYLVSQLKGMGYEVVPSDTHYFLFRVPKPATFRAALLKQGFLVRDCTSFGLPEHIRISPRNRADCENLITAIKRITTGKSTK